MREHDVRPPPGARLKFRSDRDRDRVDPDPALHPEEPVGHRNLPALRDVGDDAEPHEERDRRDLGLSAAAALAGRGRRGGHGGGGTVGVLYITRGEGA